MGTYESERNQKSNESGNIFLIVTFGLTFLGERIHEILVGIGGGFFHFDRWLRNLGLGARAWPTFDF